MFEIVPDWGHYANIRMSRESYHTKMRTFVDLLKALKSSSNGSVAFYPDPDQYRDELLFFANLFAELSGPFPDFQELRQRYWDRVYSIYDLLPRHVDPGPRNATDRLIAVFAEGQNWS